MERRRFARIAAGGLRVAATSTRARPVPRVRRVGILRPTVPFGDDRIANGIPRALADLGYVEDGGLLSYGGGLTVTYRRLALSIDQIFEGARPSDLPIDQHSRFRRVINQRTARAIGLAIPRSMLLRADEVIQ